MARAALGWSGNNLADASDIGSATVARFELGQPVRPELVVAMRKALEAKRVRFIDSGRFAGGVTLVRAG